MRKNGFDFLRKVAINKKLSSGDKITALLIWLDSWDGERFDWTFPATIPMLAKLWNIHRGTLWRHIKKLAKRGWIEVKYTRVNTIRMRPRSVAQAQHGRGTALTITKDSLSSLDLTIEQRSKIIREQQESAMNIADIVNRLDPRRGRVVATPMSQDEENEAWSLMIANNIFPAVRHQLLALEGMSIQYIKGHLEYVKLNEKENVGAAVQRMRAGDPVPEYCDLCGGIDGHHKMMVSEHTILVDCPLTYGGPFNTIEDSEDEYGELRRT